jgi:UDP-glucuronate 4-epimerase
VVRTLDRPATPNPAWNAEQPECSTSYAPYRVYNIGNNRSVNLIEFVETLEKIIGKPAIRKLLPMQAGDVLETRADISALQRDVGFAPSTPLAEGLGRFVEWYREYHGV